MNARRWIAVGAALAALTVALGAFGAHALKEQLVGERGEWWQTAAQYHALHALALVGYGLFAERARCTQTVAWLFVAGIALFSGSLYAMALGAPRWFGAITPLGGSAFIGAWVVFAVAAWRAARAPAS